MKRILEEPEPKSDTDFISNINTNPIPKIE